MQLRNAHRKKKNSGLAISTILLAVVLLAAIAVTIALSSRASNGNSSAQQAKLLATTLMNQAQNYRIGYERMLSNGMDILSITWDAAPNTGLWNPASGGTVQQFRPVAAVTYPVDDWVFRDGIQLEGVGTPTGVDFLVEIADITQPACAQINQLLYGNPAIPQTQAPSGILANWYDNAQSMDLTSDTAHATNGRPEGCIKAFDNGYVYYKTVLES